jgi:hypothetical protein
LHGSFLEHRHQMNAPRTVLYRMAMEKDLGAVIFFLKCHKPEVYNRRQVFALGGDPDNPFAVHHHGAVESNVHFYMPSNRRDQPEAEDDGDDTPPVTIDGTTIDGEDDAA